VDDSRISLWVNGEPLAVAPGSTLEDLVARLGLDRRRIAVAVNRDVVPRRTFPARHLAAGDRVEILEATGGG
jgi:sulfur carrier protein